MRKSKMAQLKLFMLENKSRAVGATFLEETSRNAQYQESSQRQTVSATLTHSITAAASPSFADNHSENSYESFSHNESAWW